MSKKNNKQEFGALRGLMFAIIPSIILWMSFIGWIKILIKIFFT